VPSGHGSGGAKLLWDIVLYQSKRRFSRESDEALFFLFTFPSTSSKGPFRPHDSQRGFWLASLPPVALISSLYHIPPLDLSGFFGPFLTLDYDFRDGNGTRRGSRQQDAW